MRVSNEFAEMIKELCKKNQIKAPMATRLVAKEMRQLKTQLNKIELKF